MPDHIHLLLFVKDIDGRGNPSPTVTSVMGWFKHQSTKKINLLGNTIGAQIFQRSYYDQIIRNQTDYNEIWEYIENNPIKWIIKN